MTKRIQFSPEVMAVIEREAVAAGVGELTILDLVTRAVVESQQRGEGAVEIELSVTKARFRITNHLST